MLYEMESTADFGASQKRQFLSNADLYCYEHMTLYLQVFAGRVVG